MTEKSGEITYDIKNLLHGKPGMVKLAPIEGLQSRTLTLGSAETLTYEISANTPFNLAKSYLNFVINPSAPGAGLANWVPVDVVSSIREIYVQTRNNIVLAYIPFADTYSKMVMKQDISITELLSYDEALDNAGSFNGLSRCDVLQASNIRYDNTAGSLSFTEPKYLLVASALNTAGPVVNNRIPLNIYRNTILSLDKDLLFPETIQIKVVFNGSGRIGWLSNSITVPNTGLTNMTSVVLTNPFLYLQVEKNPQVVDSLKQKVNSAEGLKVLFDYVYNSRQSLSGTFQSTSIKMNRNNGLTCRKILYALNNGTEATNTTFDISNVSGAKYTDFYDALNNVRLIDYNLTVAQNEDYMLNRELLKGAIASQSSNIYYYSAVFQRDFGDNVPKADESWELQNQLQGLDLSDEQKYDMNFTTVAGTYIHYIYFVCQKVLTISTSGISVM